MKENQQQAIKIVLVISSLRGGGAERVMASLANFWAEERFAVTLITFDNPLDADTYSVDPKVKRHVFYYPSGSSVLSKSFSHFHRFRKLRCFLKKEEPDVVLSFMTPTNLLTISACMGLSARCVVAERTNPEQFSYGPINDLLRRVLYRFADRVVAQTEHIACWLARTTKAKVSVIPNFIRYVPYGETVARQNTVVAVGRLSREKGFDVLIEAFSKIRDLFPDWQLLILGEGPERQNLEKLVAELNLNPSVQLCGRVDEPFVFFYFASIAVQPSRFEGFPNALLEAMTCGLPAVATYESGGMLIEHEVNGLLVPVEDAQQLANALQRLMENPSLRNALGVSALNVRETYSRERVMALWNAVMIPGRI